MTSLEAAKLHSEPHHGANVGALRAAVLGANDGIISTASLTLGVATASGDHSAILLAGVASLAAGSMSMAAGEYVSVHIQADTEQADLSRERTELASDGSSELAELASIYVNRGVDIELATQVATQLSAAMRLARMPAMNLVCPHKASRGLFRPPSPLLRVSQLAQRCHFSCRCSRRSAASSLRCPWRLLPFLEASER